MRISHVLSDDDGNYGLLDNLDINNCFSNGMDVEASILSLKNPVFDRCGAVGIETIGTYSQKAGATYDTVQQITFAGAITTGFENSGQTEYMKNYEAIPDSGYTVPVILDATLADGGYNGNQCAHMKKDGVGGFIFVGFSFHNELPPQNAEDYNYSAIHYPGYQTGGIINAKDLPKDGIDTEHQYIELDIVAMGINAGKALVYNYFYGAQVQE